MATPQIVVNDFMFCAEHGDEVCYHCCVDHRLTNNVQIEDELNNLEDVFDFGLEERQSINVFAHGAREALNTEDSFSCSKHRDVDCSNCFNWVDIIAKEAHETAEYGSWLERRSGWMDGDNDGDNGQP
ncbi:hypothetical protein AX17_002975 [Amanita inopinata Kibby_2008]|nr:hypothetical protein AX17_002975 [Amanita inopinata Kibby_2008]